MNKLSDILIKHCYEMIQKLRLPVEYNYFSSVKLEVIHVIWISCKSVGSGIIHLNLPFLIWFMYHFKGNLPIQ